MKLTTALWAIIILPIALASALGLIALPVAIVLDLYQLIVERNIESCSMVTPITLLLVIFGSIGNWISNRIC